MRYMVGYRTYMSLLPISWCTFAEQNSPQFNYIFNITLVAIFQLIKLNGVGLWLKSDIQLNLKTKKVSTCLSSLKTRFHKSKEVPDVLVCQLFQNAVQSFCNNEEKSNCGDWDDDWKPTIDIVAQSWHLTADWQDFWQIAKTVGLFADI